MWVWQSWVSTVLWFKLTKLCDQTQVPYHPDRHNIKKACFSGLPLSLHLSLFVPSVFSLSLNVPLWSSGSRKMEHRGNSWHEACFTCQRCQQPIGTRSFIHKDSSNDCLPCYEKQFAMQCIHCKKVIIKRKGKCTPEN